MATPPFDRFVKYPELSELLQSLVADHPRLMELTSIGRSYEDRDIWLATITNQVTGPHDTKPAIWIDANIHATELTGSAAALYLIHKLLTGHGNDDTVTRAVDTRTFYVVPRMNPDGAELALAERPTYVRSSARPYPFHDQQDGLVAKDMDGDGRILTMRIPDANGAWKAYADDPRLLVPRDPTETAPGPYYRLLQEGEIQNWDGETIRFAPALHGLDMNRNYPVEWRPEGEQRGAGPYPTSEPEIRAVVQAIVERRNICAFIQYHTMSGVHLRPYGTKSDDALPTFDLRVFKKIGEKATELTGYPAVSVYHDFRYDPKDVITGVADDWAYDHLGVHAWTTEFWSPQRAAGITDYKFIEWGIDHPLDDDLKLLAWADELPGEAYVDWYEYDHPQLGPIHLGGWNTAYCWRNPPPHLLEGEIAAHADWAIWHVLIAPQLRLRKAAAEPLGEGTWRVKLVVENEGWLPTNVTQKALDRKVVEPLEAELLLPDDASRSGIELVGTERRKKLGQLTGRAMKNSMIGGFGAGTDATTDRAVAEWVVRAPAGTVLQLQARHHRAGVVQAQVTLEP